jgi:hypothetical protein
MERENMKLSINTTIKFWQWNAKHGFATSERYNEQSNSVFEIEEGASSRQK